MIIPPKDQDVTADTLNWAVDESGRRIEHIREMVRVTKTRLVVTYKTKERADIYDSHPTTFLSTKIHQEAGGWASGETQA